MEASFDIVDFLRGRYIASLATQNGDGSSHLTAIWYLHDEVFYFPTSQLSRKARNIAARGLASVMVDARTTALVRGVAATGAATLIAGSEARELNRSIHLRYLTEQGLRASRLGRAVAGGDDVTIRLEPKRWHTWDLSGPYADELSSSALVLSVDV